MSEHIICNKCGKDFDIFDVLGKFYIHRELGYGTKYDGDSLRLDLCCECMEKLIDKCVVSPIIERGGK